MCALCEQNPFIRIIHDQDEAPARPALRAEAVEQIEGDDASTESA